MDIPGIATGMTDHELMDRADEQAEKLLEELKEKVRVEIEDVGTLRKKLAITVPAEVITQQLERNYNSRQSGTTRTNTYTASRSRSGGGRSGGGGRRR